MRWAAGVVTVVVIAIAGGCGVRTPTVTGTVTLDGVPVANGSIEMLPVNGKGQTAGTGVTNGRYEMPVSVGAMRVVIRSPKKSGTMRDPVGGSSQMIDRYVESVPARYNDKTELEFVVKPGRNVADFALEGNAPTGDDAPPQ